MQRGGHSIARNLPDEYTALVSTLVYTLLAYRRKLLVLQILPVPLQLGSGCPEHSPARASRSPFSLSILSRFDCPLKPSLPAATASKVCASPHSIRAGFSAAPRRASASPSSIETHRGSPSIQNSKTSQVEAIDALKGPVRDSAPGSALEWSSRSEGRSYRAQLAEEDRRTRADQGFRLSRLQDPPSKGRRARRRRTVLEHYRWRYKAVPPGSGGTEVQKTMLRLFAKYKPGRATSRLTSSFLHAAVASQATVAHRPLQPDFLWWPGVMLGGTLFRATGPEPSYPPTIGVRRELGAKPGATSESINERLLKDRALRRPDPQRCER
jgi:hypothetical protein